MTTLLCIGTGPMFSPDVTNFNGQALRSWHLASALAAEGHTVDLVLMPTEGHVVAPQTDLVTVSETDGVRVFEINATDPETLRATIQQIHDDSPYEAMVGINLNASYIAAALRSTLPAWFDLFGHLMGEAQAKCRVFGDDQFLLHFWERQSLVLRRGDRFSCVSYKQSLATLGELGAVGRLGRLVSTHPFVCTMEIAAHPSFFDAPKVAGPARFRGKVFPADSFAVLWTGGFNTWTDIPMLVGGLSLAMEQEPRLRLIVTGGAIPGHDEITYQSFLDEMDKTGLRERCHLLGWVPSSDLLPLYRECDLGLNIDSRNFETMFGARNRITNLMAAGVPIVTTLGTEISEILAENQLAFTVKIGDAAGLADTILAAVRNGARRKSLADKARAFCKEQYSYAATAKPLLTWAINPRRAPDNTEKLRLWPELTNPLHAALNPLEDIHLNMMVHPLADLLAAQRDLNIIRRKPAFRLYQWIKRTLTRKRD